MKDKKILVIRHLKDVDNLKYGLDAPLIKGQYLAVKNLAREIQEEMRTQGYNKIIFLCSPKKRTAETSKLIKSCLDSEPNARKSKIWIDKRIRELDQGQIILPENYKIGDYFEGLNKAWQVFINETFNKKNVEYKFGDFINSSDNKFLQAYFKKSGESTKDLHLRLYLAINDFSKLRDKIKDYLPVIVSHGATVAIFKQLEGIGENILNGKKFETGNLIQSCWDNYNKQLDAKSHTKFGTVKRLSENYLTNNSFRELLSDEIKYLKQKNEK